jgi:hypothetical protein
MSYSTPDRDGVQSPLANIKYPGLLWLAAESMLQPLSRIPVSRLSVALK